MSNPGSASGPTVRSPRPTSVDPRRPRCVSFREPGDTWGQDALLHPVAVQFGQGKAIVSACFELGWLPDSSFRQTCRHEMIQGFAFKDSFIHVLSQVHIIRYARQEVCCRHVYAVRQGHVEPTSTGRPTLGCKGSSAFERAGKNTMVASSVAISASDMQSC